MDASQSVAGQQGARPSERRVEVVVVTTSGIYPVHGSDSVPVQQPVKVELEKAQNKLEIADTTGWIVTVAGTVIDPNKSYAENGLRDSVKLDWGPKEGGGGKGARRNA